MQKENVKMREVFEITYDTLEKDTDIIPVDDHCRKDDLYNYIYRTGKLVKTIEVKVELTRRSPFSGEENTMCLDITEEQITEYNDGGLAQNVFPNLSADEREFIISGITSKE